MGGAKIFCRKEMRILVKKMEMKRKNKLVLPRRIITRIRPSRRACLVFIRSDLYPNYCL